MRFWLYRLPEEDFQLLTTTEAVEIDYLPEPVDDGDMVAIFISHKMEVLGAYKKEGKAFWAQGPRCHKDLRPLYEKLSFISHVSERTYKVFAKKVREITQKDFEILTSRA